jgi:hypothetical protein
MKKPVCTAKKLFKDPLRYKIKKKKKSLQKIDKKKVFVQLCQKI